MIVKLYKILFDLWGDVLANFGVWRYEKKRYAKCALCQKKFEKKYMVWLGSHGWFCSDEEATEYWETTQW